MVNNPHRKCTAKPTHNGTAIEQNFFLLLEGSDSDQDFNIWIIRTPDHPECKTFPLKTVFVTLMIHSISKG